MATMEAILEFFTQEGTEKYKNACQLHDEESKNDPETEPYKSKYKAREIWHGLKETLKSMKEENPSNVMLIFLTAVIDVKLGSNYTDTDEISSGQSHLEACIESLTGHRLDVKACNVLQNALNQLGILWTGRRNPTKALEYLQQAETLYKDFKKDVGNAPFTVDELFLPTNDDDAGKDDQTRSSNFEHTYTLTLYYLAQVYTQLSESSKAAEYCHVTLRRQLDTMKYEPLDWALNAATLSQYYITVKNFKMSRHCLASATTILKELGEPVTKCEINDDDSQADIDAKEKMPRTWCDLYRCWSKYGMALIETSRDKLMEDIDNEDENKQEDSKTSDDADHNSDKKQADNEQGASTSEDSEPVGEGADSKKSQPGEIYFNLEVTAVEEQITDQYLKSFDDVRPVFLCVQKWLNMAKEFYVLEEHCTDHIEIVQDNSNAFKQLAFFELDFERQCKMHKRRIDMLQGILGQLSKQHYMMICRQLMFEMAETYSNMLDLKLAIIEEAGQPPREHAVKKINTLCHQSIDQFQDYIDTLKTSKKEKPPKYAEEDERPALIAHFYIGRLYSKLIQFDVAQQLHNIKETLDHYQYLVDYCKKNPTSRDKIKTEVEICEEMVQLLPHKMEKIRQRGALF